MFFGIVLSRSLLIVCAWRTSEAYDGRPPEGNAVEMTLLRQYLPVATRGRLLVDDLELATIERPWIENPDGPGGLIRLSCVPEGRYRVLPHDSMRFPGTYVLENLAECVYCYERPDNQTWGRTAILIHKGNRVRDVVGCIAVGRRHGFFGQEPAVLASASALQALQEKLGRTDEHTLTIAEAPVEEQRDGNR